MLTRNNWLSVTWDGLPARQYKENICVEFRERGSIMDFQDACDQVAQDIASKYKNLYLAFSGGSDCEAVANALVRNNIPFTPVILKIQSIQNIEQWYAENWCKQHNIKPTILEISHEDLDKNILLKYSQITLPRQPLGLLPCYIAEYVDSQNGHLLTGNQLEYYPDHEQMAYLDSQLDGYQGFIFQETDMYIDTVWANKHPFGFFYWTPDIMASFINAWDESLTIQENKAQIYKVNIRPKLLPRVNAGPQHQHLSKIVHKFGTTDVYRLGNKHELLDKLVDKYYYPR